MFLDPWSKVKLMAGAVVMAACLAIALSGCPKPIPPPAPPAPDADTDAGAATCAAACARLQQLGCAAGKPTPKGAPCTEVCENVTSSGLLTWDLDCIARAVSCGATDLCAR